MSERKKFTKRLMKYSSCRTRAVRNSPGAVNKIWQGACSKKLFRREQQKKEATQLLFSLGQRAQQQLSFFPSFYSLGAPIDGNRGADVIYATGVADVTGKKPTFDGARQTAMGGRLIKRENERSWISKWVGIDWFRDALSGSFSVTLLFYHTLSHKEENWESLLWCKLDAFVWRLQVDESETCRAPFATEHSLSSLSITVAPKYNDVFVCDEIRKRNKHYSLWHPIQYVKCCIVTSLFP